MRKFLPLVLYCTLLISCGPDGTTPPPPTDNAWIIRWMQPLSFTDNTPVVPERDIGGYRVYVTDFGIEFDDNTVSPLVLADVDNELMVDVNGDYIQEGNITLWQQNSLDNTIRNMKGDCTHWISIKALSPIGNGEVVDSNFSTPFPWGPGMCID